MYSPPMGADYQARDLSRILLQAEPLQIIANLPPKRLDTSRGI